VTVLVAAAVGGGRKDVIESGFVLQQGYIPAEHHTD
jgi:hypothetical protein